MNHEIVIIIFTSPGGGEFLASSSEVSRANNKYLVLKRDLI